VIVNLISFSSRGHRASCNEVLVKLLGECGIKLAPGYTQATISFFPWLDDHILVFIRTSLVNMLLGRRTVGLFGRPGECFRKNHMKYPFKKFLFSVLKRLPGTRVLTILPFYIDPRFENVANGWIHDPQLWDLDLLMPPHERKGSSLTREICRHANRRKTIVALGGQSELKGFDFFVKLWRANLSLQERYLFIAAGEVTPECKQKARDFVDAGGFLIDRFISDEELLEFYTGADIVWSCYSPFYDVASGIFGRAFQLGKPAIVRKGSYIAALASYLDPLTLALPYGDISASSDTLLQWEPGQVSLAVRSENVGAMRDRDRETLLHALVGSGVPLRYD
jgi:hypothetical protein